MNHKIPLLFCVAIFLLPGITFSQQTDYFPNRLIIKYKSEQDLSQLRSKLNVDPKNAVQRMLTLSGARTERPLFSNQLRQQIRRQNKPSSADLLRMHEVLFNHDINIPSLAAKISRMPGVEYAEPKYIRQMSLTPNDPQLEKYVDAHNFEDAWELSQGSADVVIAIVDGGVNYLHPELDDKLWINQTEVPPTVATQADQNNDGTVTSPEIKQYLGQNGQDYNDDGTINLADALDPDSPFMDELDSDNNSLTDDLFGWDFWASGGVQDPITMDNNPILDGTVHGTHVAGIAAAETDNGIDIAGAGFNSHYMAIKAGGIPDDPSTTDTDESNAVGFGFEGIVYAANEGADIINCSWGGGSFSEAENDIINYASEMGSLVVAASGNESASKVGFPSSYDKVLSVGSVEPSQSIAYYSNYGYNLDVLATGSDILSASYDSSLVSLSGTSMATPVVSGLAALLKDLHPGWSAERIGMQIRTSASSIANTNSDERFNGKLGHGSINAYETLNTNKPGLKVVSYRFINQNGDKLSVDETGSVEVLVTNVGNTSSSNTLSLSSLDNGIQLTNNSQQLGSIATGDTVEVSFGITLSDSYDLQHIPTLRLDFNNSAQSYQDYNIIQYDDYLYDIVAANNVKTSFAANGTIGFTDPLAGTGGVGFIPRTPSGTGSYQEGENLLFEGGLMIQIDGQLYDAVREKEGVSRDFLPQQIFTTHSNSNGATIGNARFVTDTDSSKSVTIDMQTYAFSDPAISNVVFVKYTIKNPSSFYVMKNVYAGLFNDWDIGNSANNNASFSTADSILYISDASSSSQQPLVAVSHLGPVSSALAIDNTIEGQQDSVTFGLYDGFSNQEKKASLTAGTTRTTVQNTDVSAVTASGPYTINPGAEVNVGFVYAFGDDESELRNQIAEARAQNIFSVSPAGTALSDNIPNQTKLFQNYPNPFRGSTQIRIDLQQKSKVTLSIFDVLGRKVRVLVDEQLEAGEHFINFNPDNLSSGVYFAQLKTDKSTKSIPMTFIK